MVMRKMTLANKLLLAIVSIILLVGLVLASFFVFRHPEAGMDEFAVFAVFFVFAVSALSYFVFARLITKPLSLLNRSMDSLSQGDTDLRLDLHSRDEMGMLAESLNVIARELIQYRDDMEQCAKSLEEEVRKKTSEIIKAQEHLINAEKLASLGRMAAGVAHELNSPLTGIVTFSHLLMRRLPPENIQDRDELKVIIDQAERCSRIVKGLLGFSRKTASESSMVNINTLIQNTLALVKNQSRFYNVHFHVDLERNLPEICVDPNQIQQVFLNLMINAVDAMEERGDISIVSRSVEGAEGKMAELEFADSGPGIPEEILGRVFEPFFTTKPPGKGTGLGLSVSYGIIKKHGGEITVRSRKDKGASFFIRLPFRVCRGE
ncbi:MAG: ATP-binding protein [Thermodesulfovibrionales bacterium]|jgi:two-component system NtrC family sensor kinase